MANITNSEVSEDKERRRLIAEAAYRRAEQRGFTGGSPEQDWLDAEAQIDCLLRQGRSRHMVSQCR